MFSLLGAAGAFPGQASLQDFRSKQTQTYAPSTDHLEGSPRCLMRHVVTLGILSTVCNQELQLSLVWESGMPRLFRAPEFEGAGLGG